ncbi:MAG: hypothetical protein KKB51_20475 [Candidatus Riflebacteria bacterium]|nr:hypothetical protein [Candidatus Riflebacteria bacterium]
MRASRFFAAIILVLLTSCITFASDISSFLSQIQELIKKEDYSTAKGLLARRLKTDRNSYKLWLALGYVYEADSDYEQALKAFMRASELQTGIDGLATRIIRLQQLAKSQPAKKEPDASDGENKAKNLLNSARYKYSSSEYLEAYRLFIEAVELDRSILANDYGFINNGLEYFNKNANKPEHQFYLGAFCFYAGLYTRAEAMLTDYSKEYPDGTHTELTKKMIQECKDIVAQAKAAQVAAVAAAESAKSPADTKPATGTKAGETKQPSQIEVAEPQFSEPEQTFDSIPGEPIEITMGREKALKLLNDYENESDSEKQYSIIWSIGMIRLPTPQVMSKFAQLLETGNVDTIFATLEAIEKIGLPGAEICVPQIYKLLGHKDVRIVYRAILSFSRMPMQADKVVPKIFQLYQNETIEIRKRLTINTFRAYKNDAEIVLDAMLKEAEESNKKQIAEVLRVLTGEESTY